MRKGMVIEMGKQTVKRRIFMSNALMVLVTLVIFLLINAAVVKVYSESIEHELEESIRAVTDENDLKDMIEGFTVRRNEFILLFLLDGVASAPEQQRKFLETAYRRTGDMDALLNHLFYVSKLETGNMPLTLDTIELAAFINNYVKGKRELLENEPVELTADTKGIAGYVSVDGEQLRRVFDNLLENSRKYGGVTPLRVRITLERTGKGFSICFSDNGAGVAKEKLPYLFDEFYRADESRNQKEGNGLGADDYIAKPFDPAELVARVTANIRQYERMLQKLPEQKTEEAEELRKMPQGFNFTLIGLVIVVGIAAAHGKSGAAVMDLAQFSVPLAVKLFLIGMIAISAMFLPGISGSTLLLIFGAYIPVIAAIKGVLSLDFSYIPSLIFFGCGILAGAATVVKAIRACLERFRAQTIYLVLGMMIGSLYAIGMGPTTLEIPQAPLDIGNFSFVPALIGVVLVSGMQKIKDRTQKRVLR